MQGTANASEHVNRYDELLNVGGVMQGAAYASEHVNSI